MAAAPVTIKLRCASWKQLSNIYKRDLSRSALFLKAKNPPPIGTAIRIDLTLPTSSLIVLEGVVSEKVPEGGLGGRGPGVDIKLKAVPQSAMWLIESALSSAKKEGSSVRRLKDEATRQAELRSKSPPTHIPRVQQKAESVSDIAIEDGNPIVDAESKLLTALKTELESLQKLNPFQILGVGYETDDQSVRTAFGELTKRYHPDRFARFQSSGARQLAAEIFIIIRDAYRRLGNDAARRQTLANLKQKRTPAHRPTPTPTPRTPPPTPRPKVRRTPPPPPSKPAPRRPASRRPPVAAKLKEGDLFTQQGEALSKDELAAGRASREPAPPVAPAGAHSESRTMSLLDEGKYDEALAIYRLTSRKNPSDRISKAGIELAEGLKALAQRDRLEAAQRFEAVLELDPTNERAARELADMRRQATNERKGLLSRLLGKRE
jgi:curved DNA-binding protein CbpA